MSCDLIKLANRGVSGLQPYHPGKPIEELERELGISNIIKLASNENALGPSPAVLDALPAVSELYRYPDGNGFELKKVLSEFHGVSTDQITLGNGSNDILEFVARVFLGPGLKSVFSEHAFAIYPIVTQAIGATGVIVPAREFGHDLDAILAAIDDSARLVFIANPNNPTGTCLTAAELHEFMMRVPESVVVLMDEAYYEYARGEDYPDSVDWLKHFPNLVVARTFSKAYGLAGLRVGYGVSGPGMADLLNRVRQPFNVNTVALKMAAIALRDQAHIERAVEFNRRGMQQLIDGLDSMGIHFIPSRANFLCIDLEQEAQPVYDRLLHEGVIVRPVAGYGLPRHLRVTVGLESENRRFLQALSRVLSG